MSRIDEIIAQIRSDLSKYDAAGLIDEISLTRDIIRGLKDLGPAVTELHELMVEIEDQEAILPENFCSLHMAVLCDPKGYKVMSGSKYVLSSQLNVERFERRNVWEECESCCQEQEEKVIVENVVLDNSHVKYYYQNPQLLELVKPKNKSWYSSKCKNLGVKSDNKISVNKQTLTTNFKEGSVYIEYYGLPLDEDGLIDIPDTYSERIDTYLELKAKVALAERLIANNDAQQLTSIYSVWVQKEAIAQEKARNEIKMRSFTNESIRKLALKNRLETLKYDIPNLYK